MKNKELCILIILLILLGIVILIMKKVYYNESSFYDKANIMINCDEKDMIVCKISYDFQDEVKNLSFFLDYGSGLNIVKADNLNTDNHDGNYYINYSIKKDDEFLVYLKTNNYNNETNKYIALRNINFMINNKRFYVNDVNYKIK